MKSENPDQINHTNTIPKYGNKSNTHLPLHIVIIRQFIP